MIKNSLINNLKIAAIVPARGGSKGIPYKNLLKIGNLTLTELAIKVGKDCSYINDIYISTDNKIIEKIAVKAGAISTALRPNYLSNDTAKTINVVIDLLKKINKYYDLIVLLQPTSPLRTPKDITNMIDLLIEKKADSIVSIHKINGPHPYKLKIIKNGYIKSFVDNSSSEIPRQLLPDIYKLDGAVYITKSRILLKKHTFFPIKTIPYFIKNKYFINIDEYVDYLFLKYLYQNNLIKIYGL